MYKKKSGYTFLVPVVLLLGLGLLAAYTYQKRAVSPATMVVTIPSPVPTPTPLAQISPDGTHTVMLKTQGDITNILINDKLLTIRRTAPNEVISLPFNTWSPNNAYFFLQDKTDSGNEYLVFTANGTPIAKDTPYFMVADLFAKAQPDATLVEVTGWASPTLIVLNATSPKESKMSFWFDVQTQKFIRLANYFN